jgi:hypothetical protein
VAQVIEQDKFHPSTIKKITTTSVIISLSYSLF